MNKYVHNSNVYAIIATLAALLCDFVPKPWQYLMLAIGIIAAIAATTLYYKKLWTDQDK